MTANRHFRPHLAGQKIKAWREARALSAEQFGAELGKPDPWPSRTVYGWETLGKVPRDRDVVKRLERLGICTAKDWIEDALPDAAQRQQAA